MTGCYSALPETFHPIRRDTETTSKLYELALVARPGQIQESANLVGIGEGRLDLNNGLHGIVRLRNIRCFEDITLDLNAKPLTGDDPLPSLRTVLVGDNATGKSTLLRSIALGICDESGATALLKKMTGRMIRSGTESGTIELHFRSDDSNKSSVVLTKIGMSQSGAEIVRKSGDPPPDIVVVGYGTQRTRSGTQSHEQYDVATAVGTLFDDEASLQNPELVLLKQPCWIRKKVQEIVAGILGLQSDEVEYRNEAVRIIGPKSVLRC